MSHQLVLKNSPFILYRLNLSESKNTLLNYLVESVSLLNTYLFQYFWCDTLYPWIYSIFILDFAGSINLESPFNVPQNSLTFQKLHIFFLMIRRPPRSTLSSSSAASDVYKRQIFYHNALPVIFGFQDICLLYTSPSPRDRQKSRMPSSA